MNSSLLKMEARQNSSMGPWENYTCKASHQRFTKAIAFKNMHRIPGNRTTDAVVSSGERLHVGLACRGNSYVLSPLSTHSKPSLFLSSSYLLAFLSSFLVFLLNVAQECLHVCTFTHMHKHTQRKRLTAFGKQSGEKSFAQETLPSGYNTTFDVAQGCFWFYFFSEQLPSRG